MRFLPSDKYNIAWFKLAECVSRGERERALGVYRLLAHSFDDNAFARQLEGDILLAFEDYGGALDRYREAISLYQKSERSLEAAAVCEHVITLDPSKQEYIVLLTQIYTNLHMYSKAAYYLHVLCSLGLATQDLEIALAALHRLDELPEQHASLALRQQVFAQLMKEQPIPTDRGSALLFTIVDALCFTVEDDAHLQQYLMMLEATNKAYHQVATQYLSGGNN